MATAARSGRGLVFKRSGVAAAELKTITVPPLERDTLDATSFDSQDAEEFILGLKRTGTCQLVFNHIPSDTVQAGLKDDLDNGVTGSYSIVLPFGTNKTLAFSGVVQSWQPTAEVNGIQMLNVSIKVSGLPSYT